MTGSSFELYQPTQVISGVGSASRAGQFARIFGSRALLVTGSSSARATGVLQVVEASLQEADVEFDWLEGVPANPSVAVVDAGAALARSEGIDVLVAIGGGSVIDAAKAIATSAVTRRTYRSYLSGIRTERDRIDTALPVIAVPTLPGSGSETNGTSVIVDDVSGRKLSAHSDFTAPRVALLDGTWAAHAPRELLALGLADAFCHALEAALSARASVASDALAEAAIALLLRDAPRAIDADPSPAEELLLGAVGLTPRQAQLLLDAEAARTEAGEALARCLWAANLAGQALTLAGSIATHPLAHPVSARLGAHHAATVAALEPVVLALLGDRFGPGLVKVALWLGAPHNIGPAAAQRRVVNKLATYCKALGITSGLAELGVDAELVEDLAVDAMASGSRGLAGTPGEPLQLDDLRAIYLAALEVRPHVAPRALLDAATA